MDGQTDKAATIMFPPLGSIIICKAVKQKRNSELIICKAVKQKRNSELIICKAVKQNGKS